MNEIHGVIDDEDDEETKPKRGPLLQKICEIMQKTGCDYSKAYDMVMSPQSVTPESNVTDEVRQTIRAIQQNIQENQQVAARTNQSVKDFTVQGYLLDKLKGDVELIEAEKENIAVVKAGWLRKKAKAAETARKTMQVAKIMDEFQNALLKGEEQLNAERDEFIEEAKQFRGVVKAFDDGLIEAQRETKGYVKQISQSQIKEFNEE